MHTQRATNFARCYIIGKYIMLRKDIEAAIKLAAIHLDVDQTERITCPACGQEGTCMITRYQQGIYYVCFRASCSIKGFVSSIAHVFGVKDRAKFKPKYCMHDLSAIPRWVYNLLWDKYGLNRNTIKVQGFKYLKDSNRIYMPVYDIQGHFVAETTKRLNMKDITDYSPKVITYWHQDVPRLHKPISTSTTSTVVVVEDMLSANKIESCLGVNSVALLGTAMDNNVAIILRNVYNNVLIALDPDAIDKALELRNRYGIFWSNSRVLELPADPKDMSEDQLKQYIGEYI